MWLMNWFNNNKKVLKNNNKWQKKAIIREKTIRVKLI